MIAIEQAWHAPRSLRLSLLIRLEPAGSRATILNGTLGYHFMTSPSSSSKSHQPNISDSASLLQTAPLSRQAIRSRVRQARNALTLEQQRKAGKELVQQVHELSVLKNSQHIALYLSADGELDTSPLIESLWQQGKKVYLPVLHPFSKGHLLFLHYQSDTEMCHNRYGILEPKLKQSAILPSAQLDLIFTPLVAFDEQGQRLGMGGGYYDRTLAPWFHSPKQKRKGAMPIGLAHDCQRVKQLPTESWDVPLPKIVTPSQIWDWESHR